MFDDKNVLLNFWITDAAEEELEKGMGAKSRIIGGFAAGPSRDFQDEKMVLNGMNFDYLRSNQGVINWNHQDLIVGRPTYVGMMQKGLYVKGILSKMSDYPNPLTAKTKNAMEKAEEAWDHIQRHKSNPNAVPPLAFSIEGKKMSKGGYIQKSLATAVALTDQAINPHDCTVTALAKSFRDAESQEAVDFLDKSGFDLNDINSHKQYMLFCKSIDLSVDQSEILYKKIRSL